jgi:hypothetical protein
MIEPTMLVHLARDRQSELLQHGAHYRLVRAAQIAHTQRRRPRYGDWFRSLYGRWVTQGSVAERAGQC